MSSTSRSAGGKPDAPDEPKQPSAERPAPAKRAASPGRYSMNDENEQPPVRVETTRNVRRQTVKMQAQPPAPSQRPDDLGAPPPPPAAQKADFDKTLVDPVSPFDTGDLDNVMQAIMQPDEMLEPAKPPPLPKKMRERESGAAIRRPTPTSIRSASAALASFPAPAPSQPAAAMPPPVPPPPPPIATPPVAAAKPKNAPPPLTLDPIDPPREAEAPRKRNTLPITSEGPPPRAPSIPPAAPPPMLRPSSLRPPPPSSKQPNRAPSKRPSSTPIFEGFDEGSVFAAFDALMADGPTGPASQETDLAPVRELFGELAASHMRHVRDFMIDVKWGEATRDWLEICVPAVTSLFRAAERLGVEELANALDAFSKTLADSLASGGARVIEGETKDKLLSSYEKLVEILPNAFSLERDRTQREAVIIHSLLLSVPDVRKVTIDKLHAAGLTSLQHFYDGKPDEIAVVSGISREIAGRIVERFYTYRHEIQNASPSDARAAERQKLSALAETLKKHHDTYEEASKGWDSQAKTRKKESFRAREETWLEISVLLARFGEVDRLAGIEKVPYGQRIAQLAAFLEEAAENYRPSQV